jgi:hypothetical protein
VDAEEFDELKQDTLEVFEEDVQQKLEYHELIPPGEPGAAATNTRFGFTDTPSGRPATTKFDLLFSHVYIDDVRGRTKRLHRVSDEWVGDYEAKIYIPTAELDRQNDGAGLELRRDNAFIRLPDGEEYRIEAIRPIPRMYGTSVVHKLYVTKLKPIQDRPGVNG